MKYLLLVPKVAGSIVAAVAVVVVMASVALTMRDDRKRRDWWL
jgi:hypothetical protein